MAKRNLDNFLDDRHRTIQHSHDTVDGNPRPYVVIVEPQSGRSVFAFREGQRYWSGTPEETQRLINALTDSMVAADQLRNHAQQPLNIELPENIDEMLNAAFDMIDMQAITKHEEWVPPSRKPGDN